MSNEQKKIVVESELNLGQESVMEEEHIEFDSESQEKAEFSEEVEIPQGLDLSIITPLVISRMLKHCKKLENKTIEDKIVDFMTASKLSFGFEEILLSMYVLCHAKAYLKETFKSVENGVNAYLAYFKNPETKAAFCKSYTFTKESTIKHYTLLKNVEKWISEHVDQIEVTEAQLFARIPRAEKRVIELFEEEAEEKDSDEEDSSEEKQERYEISKTKSIKKKEKSNKKEEISMEEIKKFTVNGKFDTAAFLRQYNQIKQEPLHGVIPPMVVYCGRSVCRQCWHLNTPGDLPSEMREDYFLDKEKFNTNKPNTEAFDKVYASKEKKFQSTYPVRVCGDCSILFKSIWNKTIEQLSQNKLNYPFGCLKFNDHVTYKVETTKEPTSSNAIVYLTYYLGNALFSKIGFVGSMGASFTIALFYTASNESQMLLPVGCPEFITQYKIFTSKPLAEGNMGKEICESYLASNEDSSFLAFTEYICRNVITLIEKKHLQWFRRPDLERKGNSGYTQCIPIQTLFYLKNNVAVKKNTIKEENLWL